jgi:hypothetical protein
VAKVSAEIGLTLALSKESNEYLRINGTVSEIDTELPLENQLLAIEETFSAVVDLTQKMLDAKLDEMVSRGVFKL